MKTVKARDFVRQFPQYKDEKVIVVGRHEEIIGTWTPEELKRYGTKDVRQDMSDKEENVGQTKAFKEAESKAKKQLNKLNDLVAGVMNKDGTTIIETPNEETIEVGNEKRQLPSEYVPMIYDGEKLDKLPTEMCTRCKKQKTELWHMCSEDGDHEICEECIYEGISPRKMAVACMEQCEKVEIQRCEKPTFEAMETLTSLPEKLHNATPSNTFNPMPKPVKKKKKK